jgi:hypothetical protein
MPKTVVTTKTAAQIAALDIFEKNKYDLTTAFRKSKAWYEQQMILLMKQVQSPSVILKGNPSQLTMKLMPGKMYMYIYDPLYKDELPYFDRFPCTLLYKRSHKGFSGINFHYLPYQMRMKLLYYLLRVYKTNPKMDESTRIKYSWDAIKGVHKFAAAVPAFKNYSFAGLRSTFREIRAYDWATAVLLPVEQFVKLSDDRIWDKSRRYVLGTLTGRIR